ncbi:hypothetical protein PQX77_015310 [Marasmius sp. AFHP31]|nr:hypothetical protein PQX77_015310 [Marasmius sp. AFHP31]
MSKASKAGFPHQINPPFGPCSACHNWGPRWALLFLPHGSTCRNLDNDTKLIERAQLYWRQWYDFADKRVHPGNGQALYLITGVRRCAMWAMAAWDSISSDARDDLGLLELTIDGATCNWALPPSRCSTQTSGPASGNDSQSHQETVFIRAFRIDRFARSTHSRPSGPSRHLPGAEKDSNSDSDSNSRGNGPRDPPFGDSSSDPSSSTDPASSGGGHSGASNPQSDSIHPSGDTAYTLELNLNLYNAKDDSVTHPCGVINKFAFDLVSCLKPALLESGCAAISHDDDWIGIIQESDEKFPPGAEIIQRICSNVKFAIKGGECHTCRNHGLLERRETTPRQSQCSVISVLVVFLENGNTTVSIVTVDSNDPELREMGSDTASTQLAPVLGDEAAFVPGTYSAVAPPDLNRPQLTLTGAYESLRNKIADVGASHEARQQYTRGSCLEKTRQGALGNIRDWRSKKDQEHPIYWLSGAAGVGKSAIAITVAKACEAEGTLVSSFFFFRSDPKRNNPFALWLTIADGLASTMPLLRNKIEQRIAKDPKVLEATMEEQFRELIFEPVLACSRQRSVWGILTNLLSSSVVPNIRNDWLRLVGLTLLWPTPLSGLPRLLVITCVLSTLAYVLLAYVLRAAPYIFAARAAFMVFITSDASAQPGRVTITRVLPMLACLLANQLFIVYVLRAAPYMFAALAAFRVFTPSRPSAHPGRVAIAYVLSSLAIPAHVSAAQSLRAASYILEARGWSSLTAYVCFLAMHLSIVAALLAITPSYPSMQTEKPDLVIIDGLDECSDEDTQLRIISTIESAFRRSPNFPLRFLICSRPEAWLLKVFAARPLRQLSKVVVLDDSFRPEADIRRYYVHHFLAMVNNPKYKAVRFPDPWPSEADLDELVGMSCSQLVYAATAVRFINLEFEHPIEQLQVILRNTAHRRPGALPYQELDALYDLILSANPDYEEVMSILSTILILPGYLEPTPAHIELVLGLPAGQVALTLWGMRSVLDIHGYEDAIRLHHTSFREYLVDRTRSGNFHIDLDAQKYVIGCRWLQGLTTSKIQTYSPNQVWGEEDKSFFTGWIGLCTLMLEPTGDLLDDLWNVDLASTFLVCQQSSWKDVFEGLVLWVKKHHGPGKEDVANRLIHKFQNHPECFHLKYPPYVSPQQDVLYWVVSRATGCVRTTRLDGSPPGDTDIVHLLDCHCIGMESGDSGHLAYQESCLQLFKAFISLLKELAQSSVENEGTIMELTGVFGNVTNSLLLGHCRLDPESVSLCQTFFELAKGCLGLQVESSDGWAGRKNLLDWIETFPARFAEEGEAMRAQVSALPWERWAQNWDRHLEMGLGGGGHLRGDRKGKGKATE